MRRPIITLITDFGLSDHYAGVLHGVILGICPQAEIVDISHQIGAYEVMEGAFLLAQTYPYFPRGTVHVVVIDPGVGTARRPIVAEAAGHRFVAPDNGVLSMMYAREKPKVRWVTAEKYFLKPVSQTFHGRDVFAPVGAHLARGVAAAKMGRQVADYLRLHFERPVRTARRAWTGAVLKIDRFGNLITNFPAEDFPELQKRPFELSIGLETVSRLAQNYAESPPGALFIITGSSGYLEVSASQASAAKALGCGVGAPVELRIL